MSISMEEAQQLVSTVRHWHHAFEVFPKVKTPGTYDPHFLFSKLHLPADLSGMRALDIGASDGFFSRSLLERGASVVSIDYRDKGHCGFGVMEHLSGHSFDYRVMNIYEATAKELGTFDLVLFLGVLYHLPDMIRALQIVRSLARQTIFVETHCENDFCAHIPAAKYYVDDTLCGDWTNFWAPNRLCMLDMLYDAGFDVKRDEGWGKRLLVEATVTFDRMRLRKIETAYGTIR